MIRFPVGWRWILFGGVFTWLIIVLVMKNVSTVSNRGEGEITGKVGRHWMGFTGREARLAARVREGEDQVQWLKIQLANTQKKMTRDLMKRREESEAEQLGCDKVPPACQEIQVAIVCAGADASRTVVTLVKSILFYRRNPIHLHFISDPEARTILSLLFSTWSIPQLRVSFYKTEDVVNDVSWIPNKHYSGVFGLLKLTLPKILPSTLEDVIILDTDVTFATDIGKLWTVFRKFNKKQALGLVENQSDWYIPGKLWKNHRPWPALGRGLNTGVILMRVSALRRMNWSQTWRTVAESDLVTQLSTSLADQDVLNAVIKRQTELLYTLDCSWNVQMSDNSLSDTLCYDSKSKQVNVIHFNSPKKLQSTHKHISYFRHLYLTFLQYDGNLLRRELYSCQPDTATTDNTDDDMKHESNANVEATPESPCSDLNSTIQYRTHVNFLANCLHKQSDAGVTLVLQMSVDRLSMLELILSHWSGPVSAALYLTDAESQVFLDLHSSSSQLNSRCNVGYHVVYKEGLHYPVNFLRNLAMDRVQTKYVFLSDVDFLPSHGSFQALQSQVQTLLTDHTNRVLVVPAFESNRYTSTSNFPATKADLLKKLDLGEVFTFRSGEWPAGHRPTNYPHWRTATIPFTVSWRMCMELCMNLSWRPVMMVCLLPRSFCSCSMLLRWPDISSFLMSNSSVNCWMLLSLSLEMMPCFSRSWSRLLCLASLFSASFSRCSTLPVNLEI